MKYSYYDKMLKFSTELLRLDFNPTKNQTYIEKALDLIDNVLGFPNAMMASLSNRGEKTISSNLVVHNVNFSIAQQILVEYWNNPDILDLRTDEFVLSRQEDYKNGDLYQKICKPNGYTDFFLRFNKSSRSRRYLSYMILLSTKGVFSDDEIQVIDSVSENLALAHINNIRTWDLRNRMNWLTDNMNYFPMGILLIAKANQVVYTNEIARMYLEKLGVTDSRLYSTFYTNNLYPYYMHNMRSHKASLPVRIGDYLFNVTATTGGNDDCPAQVVFENEINAPLNAEELLSSINNISTCVYIIYSGSQDVRFSGPQLADLGLTRREQEMAELVTKGLNNRELAAAMGIKENTVKTHLANIYKKLGINYRTELTDMVYKMHRSE